MKILDKYILSKYFKTFIFTVLLLLPIAIAIDISEKIRKFINHEDLSIWTIAKDHYLNFVIYYANTFMPLALFLAVILFTSKLASNTEIIAINSGGVSFPRLMRPYMIGATIVFIFAFYANHFIVPNSSKVGGKFYREYIASTWSMRGKDRVENINVQLDNNNFLYFKDFNLKSNNGNYFSYEHFEDGVLKYKLTSRRIKYQRKNKISNKKDSLQSKVDTSFIYRLKDYRKRYIHKRKDIIVKGKEFDTIFNIKPKELKTVDYLAKEMNSFELDKKIKIAEKRGVKNLNPWRVELYKRSSMPTSVFALTIIAVALAHRKRRGGMGVNLAVGVGLMFFYVFFMKIFEVIAASSNTNPLLLVWLPNIIFGILAIFLYLHARK